MYYHGEGTKTDLQKAIFWMSKAYKNGVEGARELLFSFTTEAPLFDQ